MTLRSIAVEGAPKAIGPYSQGQVIELQGVGRLVYTAGQVGLDPTRGELVAGGIVEQTERVMQNLSAVLQAAGVDWSKVVKTTVFLTDLGDFPVFNEVYGRHLGSARPARSTVQVSALPRNAVVEIEVVAKLEG